MIKVSKPTTVPGILSGRGRTASSRNCRTYSKNPVPYISGERSFDIKNEIYGHHGVKSPLRTAQFDKCCFCEKSQDDEDGAIDHHRPKNGYKSKKTEKLSKPGYYWLGYDWDNLYFICSACNGASNKSNLFPLAKEERRAKSHKDNILSEDPLLLNPGGAKDPRNHIVFDREYPRGKTKYGRATINICGLDRHALIEKRKKLMSNIEAWVYILADKANSSPQKRAEATKFLRAAQLPDAEFSAAATDYIKTFNIAGL